jgi:cation diffusion facilitator family transporter
VVAALLANAGIAVAKFVGFLITGAGSMLAESVHSVADSGNQALLLLGGRRAKRAPTEDHPFGYGRERYFWAFVVALILFSVGGMFAVYEGVEKIRHPHELESVNVAIGILLVAIVLELWSFRTAVIESSAVKDPQLSWWGFIRRTKQPELPVVLLEDLGALVGLVIALTAVTVSHITGDPLWDGIGTLSIGLLLIGIAIVLAIEMKGLLIGESASVTDQEKIAAAIEIEPSVQRLIHMRTQHIGPDELLVGAKIELIPGLSVPEAVETVNRVETSVRRAVPTARVMYLEPDIFRTRVPRQGTAPAHLGAPGPEEGTAAEAEPNGEPAEPEPRRTEPDTAAGQAPTRVAEPDPAAEPEPDAGDAPAPTPRQS